MAIQVALIGCGGMAHWHAQQLQRLPDVKVIAVADINQAATKHFRERYFNDAREYASYDDLMAAPPAGLEAVVLVTPHTMHYPQARLALDSGLHVLVEKPMVTSSEHAYALWEAVKRSGKLLGITFQSPYTAEFSYLAAERDAGRLGKMQLISGWLTQHWMANTARTWRQDPSLSGGGQMYDSGAHLLNAVMWLMNDPVIEVACFYDKCGTPVDINGAAIARFQNGAMASLTIGGNCPTFRTEIQIQTDRFFIITDQYGSKLEINGHDGRRIYPHVEQKPNASGSPHENFINAILGREPLRAPVRYGVLLSALMDAMYESGNTGSMVKVKPVPSAI